MKNISKITLAISFIFISTFSFSQNVKEGLIGKWESDVIANSKVGTMWEFNKNGTVEITSGAIVHYIYMFKGKQLISALFNHITGETELDTSFIEIKGDSLFQKYKIKGKEHSRVMHRVGKKTTKGISEFGTWETTNIAGQKSYYHFNSDHTLILRIPLSVQRGTYKLNGFKLYLKIKDLQEEVYDIIFLSHSLSLKNSKTEKTFHRLLE